MFKKLVFLLISLEWFSFGALDVDDGSHVIKKQMRTGKCGIRAWWKDDCCTNPDISLGVYNDEAGYSHHTGTKQDQGTGDWDVTTNFEVFVNASNYENRYLLLAAYDRECCKAFCSSWCFENRGQDVIYPGESLYENDKSNKSIALGGSAEGWCMAVIQVTPFSCTNRRATTNSSGRCDSKWDQAGSCYAQLSSSGGFSGYCANTCPESLADASGGKCVKKLCPKRRVNTSSVYDYPCLEFNCYRQLDKTTGLEMGEGVEGSCDSSCHSPLAEQKDSGKCVLRACTDRAATTGSGYKYPCGTSDCYQLLDTETGSLKTGAGSCGESTSCPTSLSTARDGKCELKDCTGRTKTDGYTYQCGTADCYLQLNPSGNGTYSDICGNAGSCPSSLSEAKNGYCRLLDCGHRYVNETHKYRCGTADCYRQMENGGIWPGDLSESCNNNCNPMLFMPTNPNGDGNCKLKTCINRYAQEDLQFPCGTVDCYQQRDNGGKKPGTLNSSCDDDCAPWHFQTSPLGGICEYKECKYRASVELPFPCGTEDCYQQVDNGDAGSSTCRDDCEPKHQLFTENGQCMLKNCSERVYVPIVTFPCGSEDCYRQLDNGGTGSGTLNASCDDTCDPRHFVKSNTGICELKKCEKRVSVPSLAFPCGTEDCHQLVDNGGTGSGTLNASCGACDPRHFLESETGGICKLKKCKARVSVPSLEFPCGTEDCHQQVDNGGKGSGTLNASCGACDPRHFLESETGGVCKLKKCEKRVSVLSLEFPCGTEDCYQQTSTENGTCDNSEPAVIIPPKSQSRKTDPTVIIIVVVVTVVVMVAVLVIIIILLVVFRRGHKQTTIIMEDFNSHSTIGDYSMGSKLGEGKFGEVFEVSKDGQSFAARRIHKNNTAYSGDLDEFSPKISSEFLVKYFGIIPGDNDDELYVLMELCNQGTLHTLLEFLRKDHNDAGLAPGRVLKVMIQLLLGLDVLHRNSIVHRGLKPTNIFIDQDDNVKIGDFADNKLQSEDEKAACLTVAYTPKEVLANHQCTTSSDMYSLGVILYELCSLSLPYSTIMDINTGEYKSISRPDIPEALSEIIYSLLDMNPNNRPSAFGLLQNDFVRGNAGQFGLLNYFPSSE